MALDIANQKSLKGFLCKCWFLEPKILSYILQKTAPHLSFLMFNMKTQSESESGTFLTLRFGFHKNLPLPHPKCLLEI